MEGGIFDGFLTGVGDLLSGGAAAVRDIFLAKEETKQARATQSTTANALLVGKEISVEQIRVIALAVLGVVALVLLTRKARA